MSRNDDQKKRPTGPGQPPHVSDLILGSLKSRTGKDTSKWIAGLADEAVKEAAEHAAKTQDPQAQSGPQNFEALAAPSGTIKQAVIKFLDQQFDFFAQIEFEFNKTVAGSDFVVTIERPVFTNEKVRMQFGAYETIKVFRGRISTRYWTLIVRARDEIIEFWLVPVEQIIGFRADDNRYAPYIVIQPVASRTNELMWSVNGAQMNKMQARELAKQIFTTLILVANGERSESERFSISTADQPTAAPPSAAPINNVLPPPPVSTMMNNPLTDSQKNRVLPTGSTPLQTLPRSNSGRRTLSGTRTNKAVREQAGNLDAAMETLLAAINGHIEKLSAKGAAAFSRQDMGRVQEIYRRTNRLKELQTQIGEGVKELKSSLDDLPD